MKRTVHAPASALVATVGDAKNLKNGRRLAAGLGLVRKRQSSGGKPVLLPISKRGREPMEAETHASRHWSILSK